MRDQFLLIKLETDLKFMTKLIKIAYESQTNNGLIFDKKLQAEASKDSEICENNIHSKKFENQIQHFSKI